MLGRGVTRFLRKHSILNTTFEALEKTYVVKVAFTAYRLQEEEATPESKYITSWAPTAQSANWCL